MASNLQNLLDLIRHGKQHHNAPKPAPDSPLSPTSASSRKNVPASAAVASPKSAPESPPKSAAPPPRDAEAPPPDHREAAEQIVKDEREAKDRMPTHKGLENFQLLEKMGECVPFLSSSLPLCQLTNDIISQWSLFQRVQSA